MRGSRAIGGSNLERANSKKKKSGGAFAPPLVGLGIGTTEHPRAPFVNAPSVPRTLEHERRQLRDPTSANSYRRRPDRAPWHLARFIGVLRQNARACPTLAQSRR